MAYVPSVTCRARVHHHLAGIVLVATTLLASAGARAESAFDDFAPLTIRVYDLGGIDSTRLAAALIDVSRPRPARTQARRSLEP